MYVIANRDGEMGGICPLFFDGAVCDFEELPRPDEVDKLQKYYTRVKNIRSYKQTKKFESLALLTLFKKITRKIH
jgi:hypothetical protein